MQARTTQAHPTPLRPGRAASWADRHVRLLLVLPAVILTAAMTLFPLGYSLWASFVRFDFRMPGHPWVGFANFAAIIRDPVALQSLWHTAVVVVVLVACQFVAGLVLALTLARSFRGRNLVIPILVLPLFMSPVVVGQLWRLLLEPQTGPTNYLLGLMLPGEVTISWFTQWPFNWIAIIIADSWQWTPFMLIILLAGLTTIPHELYEAAELDGASAWQKFRHVTTPLLAPIATLAIVFRTIDAIKLFDVVYVLTGGGPGTSTYTAPYYLYERGLQFFDIGPAAAGSWMLLILTLIVAFRLVVRLLPEKRR